MSGGMSAMTDPGLPPAQGLYDPAHEHDACGVGFVVDIKGRKSHAIVSQALTVEPEWAIGRRVGPGGL